jgi:fructose-1,6-bisphosphatase/inositol monophosphatase family enzyme
MTTIDDRAIEEYTAFACRLADLAGTDYPAVFSRAPRSWRMRRYGGDCYSFCLVAAGFVDLVIEAGLQPYDIQPLISIIEAAGGIVTSWLGGSPYDGAQVIAVGDRELHKTVLAMLGDRRSAD